MVYDSVNFALSLNRVSFSILISQCDSRCLTDPVMIPVIDRPPNSGMGGRRWEGASRVRMVGRGWRPQTFAKPHQCACPSAQKGAPRLLLRCRRPPASIDASISSKTNLQTRRMQNHLESSEVSLICAESVRYTVNIMQKFRYCF